MALFFFILFFFLTKPVFAAPTVQITVAPSNLSSVGTSFPVQFTIQGSDLGVSYHYKFYGGIGDTKTQIQTTDSLSYTSSWDSFTTITVDSEGKSVVNSYAYIKSDSLSGSYNLYVRIAKSDDHDTYYNSSAYSVTISVPTPTPSPTSIPTATPTPDPTITNPTSGISLTEFMPYSDPEWVEIYNSNDYPVKLVSWKLEDKDANTRNISTLSIPAKSYLVFEYSPFFDNNNAETVILRNQNNTAIGQYSYTAGLRTLDRSWSSIKGNWCQSNITKGYENVTSCYSSPTSTPVLTPTPDQSKYTPSDTATESAIIEPTSESSFLSPSPQPTATPTTGSVLGEDNSNTTKKNYLPLILIISGGLLLTSPLIISKLKK